MKVWYERLAASLVGSFMGLQRDERAITALEYGIIASALAFVFIAAFAHLGVPLSTIFNSVGSGL
jgi:Flp pilus assembly pilin Flp